MVDTKNALKMLWKDTCTVLEYQEYIKPNKSTAHKEFTVLENQPCKLSFESLQTVNQTDTTAALLQKAKLFISNEFTIKAGSKIVVAHCNRIFEFSQSGEAGVFGNHQEIMLIPFRGWA